MRTNSKTPLCGKAEGYFAFREGLAVWKGPQSIADTGDVVHVDIVESGKLDQAFNGDSDLSFFVVGIGGLGNMDGVCDLGLIQVVIVAQGFDAFGV